MSIIFSQGSGVADSVFGKSQAPIKAMIESGVEAFQQFSAVDKVFSMDTTKSTAIIIKEAMFKIRCTVWKPSEIS